MQGIDRVTGKKKAQQFLLQFELFEFLHLWNVRQSVVGGKFSGLSPGIFFSAGKSKTGSSGKTIFTARIIPSRGSWIDFEFDTKDILYVRIDRRRKLPATVLLRALGYTTEELLNHFYQREKFIFSETGWLKETTNELLQIQTAETDVVDADGKVIVRAGKRFLKPHIRKLQKAGLLVEDIREVGGREEKVLVGRFPVSEGSILGRISAYDVVDSLEKEIEAEIAAWNEFKNAR